MLLREHRKRSPIGEAELNTALILGKEKSDAKAVKKQKRLDEKREIEERTLAENNRISQEESDLQTAQLLKERAAEKATVKASKNSQKKHEKRGLEVAKEVAKRKAQVTLEYNKVLAQLEAQKVLDVNNSSEVIRPRKGIKKSARKNLFGADMNANFSSKKGLSLRRPLPSSWRDQQPRVTPEVDNNQPRFKNNESIEDSMKWMLGQQFNQRFVKTFAKWSGSTLIAASDENLHHVGEDRAEVARLITLLEVEVKRAEDVSQRSQVIDISAEDKAPSDEKTIQGGEYKFVTLDDDFMYHPSKLEGRNKVRVATALRRLCGGTNFDNFTKLGEIGFTATSVREKIQKDHLLGQLDSHSFNAMTNQEADNSNKAFYYGKVKDLPVFENNVVMLAMLQSEGNLMRCSDPDIFSILSFSKVPGVLIGLGHTPDTDKVGHIVRTLQHLDYSYATLGGAVVWLNTTIQLRTWLESPLGGRVSPAFLLFKIHMAYIRFLELVSKATCTDPDLVGFALRTQAGWRDLLISLLFNVTKVTFAEEENYIRQTEKTFSWLSPSVQKKKPQKEDKILGKAPKVVKQVCINFLCGTLQIKDTKGHRVLCTNSPCHYEHLNLKSMKMASAMTRIRALPQGGKKQSIVSAAKVYPSYKT
jgi:hypothetical protein